MGKLTFKGHFNEGFCDNTGKRVIGVRQVKLQNKICFLHEEIHTESIVIKVMFH